jgi:hypothetical protein
MANIAVLTGLSGGGWQSGGPTNDDWLQVDFYGYRMIDEIDVFMIQDDYASPHRANPRHPIYQIRFD